MFRKDNAALLDYPCEKDKLCGHLLLIWAHVESYLMSDWHSRARWAAVWGGMHGQMRSQRAASLQVSSNIRSAHE